ncbi:RING finger domain protein, putative [Talaromyces stipitatus ATCC 10500]|uniref:RING finger domain protein, putative n=1 Tax=Talaromyces stipitatus (strain ATCC 10500 / CBS 375.48 / QM 6759 / NRRL 1006) TaxID=441959 RepID=B8M2J8_TALSN|nr:RING finger domain protein, putative [Talaromyces stipitatus ATCC 10500]EED21909.1 RING finger domain protein, putative [Talaromyces stipitatus ATCC 10500]
MAHSKRNTSLPHFTSYERSLLRSNWGTQRTRLSRESFLPFGSCQLCLQPAREPVVACAHNGDLFCRECAISDLLAQRKEIKRMEREREEDMRRGAEEEAKMMQEARERELKEFELVSMGLEGASQNSGNNKKRKAPTMMDGKEDTGCSTTARIDKVTEEFRQREVEVNGKRRKVFELSEAEISRYAKTELERLKKKIEQEKAEAKSALPSFWIPSETPGTENQASKNLKLSPICPGSTKENRHEYSLKTLVDVNFTEEKTELAGGTTTRICPSCKKSLTNGLKAMLTKPCGHVICQPCVTKFMTPETTIDPHRTDQEDAAIGRMLCYVCETDITPINKHSKSSKEKHKEGKSGKIKPGLVEIKSEGTGFAGGGDNMAKKQGVAFQC